MCVFYLSKHAFICPRHSYLLDALASVWNGPGLKEYCVRSTCHATNMGVTTSMSQNEPRMSQHEPTDCSGIMLFLTPEIDVKSHVV